VDFWLPQVLLLLLLLLSQDHLVRRMSSCHPSNGSWLAPVCCPNEPYLGDCPIWNWEGKMKIRFNCLLLPPLMSRHELEDSALEVFFGFQLKDF